MAGACGRRQEDLGSPIRAQEFRLPPRARLEPASSPQCPPTGGPTECEDGQGTLHQRCIAAGDIEASCSSDWPIRCATPKLSAKWPCSGASSGRVLVAPREREEKVWEATPEVTNIQASSSFAELKELREADDTSAQRWNVVFAHLPLPPSVEPLLTGSNCGRESVLLGRPLDLFSPPRARVCLDVTPDHTLRSTFLPHLAVELEHSTCDAGAKVSYDHKHSGEPTPFSRVQGGRLKL